MKENKDLVTIGVITYNSEKTIVETLESIKEQTYENLELIISDDGSKDNTVDICTKWRKNNLYRFVKIEILTTEHNTGISGNLNRAVLASTGSWFKVLAGDDLLTKDCIERYLIYIHQHPNVNVLFSRINSFKVIGEKHTIVATTPSSDRIAKFCSLSAEEQLINILNDDSMLPAPSTMYRTSFIKENLYNEKYKYEDDYPMWVTLTRKGFKLDFIDEVLVMYRLGESISRPPTTYFSRNYLHTRNQFFWDDCYELYKRYNLEEGYNKYKKWLYRCELIDAFTANRRSLFNSIIVRIINFYVNKFVRFKLSK